MLSVDATRCVKDGLCVAECPVKILFMENETPPVMVKGGAELCLRCGHCVAVCPTEALSMEFLEPAACPPIRKELVATPEMVDQLMKGRRSIRNFKDTPVEKGVIEDLLALASHAPTGHNTRTVGFLVIHEKDEVTRLTGMVADWMRYMIKEQPKVARALHLAESVAGYEMGLDVICRSAPHVVIAHAAKIAPTAAIDCATALSYLELAAPSRGLGSCWAGFFNVAATFWPPMQKALAIPEGHAIHGSVLLGTPRYRYKRIPVRTPPAISWR